MFGQPAGAAPPAFGFPSMSLQQQPQQQPPAAAAVPTSSDSDHKMRLLSFFRDHNPANASVEGVEKLVSRMVVNDCSLCIVSVFVDV